MASKGRPPSPSRTEAPNNPPPHGASVGEESLDLEFLEEHTHSEDSDYENSTIDYPDDESAAAEIYHNDDSGSAQHFEDPISTADTSVVSSTDSLYTQDIPNSPAMQRAVLEGYEARLNSEEQAGAGNPFEKSESVENAQNEITKSCTGLDDTAMLGPDGALEPLPRSSKKAPSEGSEHMYSEASSESNSSLSSSDSFAQVSRCAKTKIDIDILPRRANAETLPAHMIDIINEAETQLLKELNELPNDRQRVLRMIPVTRRYFPPRSFGQLLQHVELLKGYNNIEFLERAYMPERFDLTVMMTPHRVPTASEEEEEREERRRCTNPQRAPQNTPVNAINLNLSPPRGRNGHASMAGDGASSSSSSATPDIPNPSQAGVPPTVADPSGTSRSESGSVDRSLLGPHHDPAQIAPLAPQAPGTAADRSMADSGSSSSSSKSRPLLDGTPPMPPRLPSPPSLRATTTSDGTSSESVFSPDMRPLLSRTPPHVPVLGSPRTVARTIADHPSAASLIPSRLRPPVDRASHDSSAPPTGVERITSADRYFNIDTPERRSIMESAAPPPPAPEPSPALSNDPGDAGMGDFSALQARLRDVAARVDSSGRAPLSRFATPTMTGSGGKLTRLMEGLGDTSTDHNVVDEAPRVSQRRPSLDTTSTQAKSDEEGDRSSSGGVSLGSQAHAFSCIVIFKANLILQIHRLDHQRNQPSQKANSLQSLPPQPKPQGLNNRVPSVQHWFHQYYGILEPPRCHQHLQQQQQPPYPRK